MNYNNDFRQQHQLESQVLKRRKDDCEVLWQADLPSNSMIGLESPSKKLEVASTQSTLSLGGADREANVVNFRDSRAEVGTWILEYPT